MYARDIHFVESPQDILANPGQSTEMREGLLQGDVYVARGFMARDAILKIRDYLAGIGRSSLPNYCAIENSK